MAQVISKCRVTGHYMFMGLNVHAENFVNFPEPFARKFCPFCACEHAWYKKDSKLVDKRPLMRHTIQQAS